MQSEAPETLRHRRFIRKFTDNHVGKAELYTVPEAVTEYHTLTEDGPIFNPPVRYTSGSVVHQGDHPFIDIMYPASTILPPVWKGF